MLHGPLALLRASASAITAHAVASAELNCARVRQIAVIDRDDELGQPTAGAQREAQQRSSHA